MDNTFIPNEEERAVMYERVKAFADLEHPDMNALRDHSMEFAYLTLYELFKSNEEVTISLSREMPHDGFGYVCLEGHRFTISDIRMFRMASAFADNFEISAEYDIGMRIYFGFYGA